MLSGRRLRLLLGGSLFFAVTFGFPKDLSPPLKAMPGRLAAQQVTNTPGSFVLPATATATPPSSSVQTRTPTPTATRPTRTPRATATPTVTNTVPPPSPTLPGFTILTPTPIIDVFDPPPGNFTGPIPTPTLPQFAAPGAVPDLIAYDIEITQGMQDLYQHMPLVADRLTFVRIYVKTDGADYPNVKGLLQGTRDGQVLGVIPADNQPILARGDGGERINVDDSLYFGLPWSWFEEGTLHLNAFVYAGSPNAPFEEEPESFNNFIQTSAIFHPGQPVKFSFIPIHLHENYDGDQPEKLFTTSEPSFWSVVIGMLRHLPVPGFELYAPPVDKIYCSASGGAEAGVFAGVDLPGEHGDCEFNLQVPGGADYVTVMMAYMDFLNDPPVEGVNYYGMVHPDFEPQMTFFNSQGGSISYTGLALNGEAYGSMNTAQQAAPLPPWFLKGGSTLAHEMGHRMGLAHVLCAGSEEAGGGIDEDFPWTEADCSIANVNEEGYYGFDVYYELLPYVNEPTVISNDPSAASPNQGFPLMGYKKPQWIDAYYWCKLLQATGVDCNIDVVPFLSMTKGPGLAGPSERPAPDVSASPQAAQLEAGPFLLVSGQIVKDPAQATIGQAMTLPEPPANDHAYPDASEVETGFSLVLLDAAGQTLTSQPIRETTINHESLNSIAFVQGFHLPEGAAKLVIQLSGQTLAERTFSPNPPAVRVTTPNGGEAFTSPFEIRWEASDADGDPLDFTLQYSPDNGQTWHIVALGLTDNAYQVLSLYNLTGSDQAKIRVLASDGANTAIDESDGVFSIPNTPPLPAIQSPGNLAVFPVAARVPLSGSATDREDGLLAPDSLTWESNVDGFLGTGARLEPSTLSPGYHVLTLTAEDGQGLSAQAHVGITVDPSLARYLPDEAELALGSQILAAGPDWTGASQGFPLSTLLVLGALAVLALVGFGFLLPLLRSWVRR